MGDLPPCTLLFQPLSACLDRYMIIACPACATRYVVPDSAIGVDGRTVRCAKCRHSWFQAGPELPPRPSEQAAQPETAAADAAFSETAAPAAAGVAAPQPAPPPVTVAPAPAVASDVPPAPAPRAEPPRAAPPASEYVSPVSSFEHQPPFRPRRNPARLWTAAGITFALAVAAMIGLVSWLGLPDWLPVNRPTFGNGRPDLVLSFPPARQDRRTLSNGTAYFGASGTVTNVGKDLRDVPPILIVLRDAQNRIVYTWDVAPPKDKLRPGESVTINEAVTDVPKSARSAEIGWKPE